MKITLEFDDSLKPMLAKMLSPAIDKMRLQSSKEKAMRDGISRADYMATYSLLTKLDFELNMGKDQEATIQP